MRSLDELDKYFPDKNFQTAVERAYAVSLELEARHVAPIHIAIALLNGDAGDPHLSPSLAKELSDIQRYEPIPSGVDFPGISSVWLYYKALPSSLDAHRRLFAALVWYAHEDASLPRFRLSLARHDYSLTWVVDHVRRVGTRDRVQSPVTGKQIWPWIEQGIEEVGRLRVSAEVPVWVDASEASRLLAELVGALSELHITAGGSGLVIDGIDIGVSVFEDAER